MQLAYEAGSPTPQPLWREQLAGISAMRAAQAAPSAVDVYGAERYASDAGVAPAMRRLRVLISAMLSSQTRDELNAKAMANLIAHGLTVDALLEISVDALTELIRDVGFRNNKAKYIKAAAALLREKHADDVPASVEELVALPGVGPKMAMLVMNVAWSKPVGICVDTHVHRIANRLGWVRTWVSGSDGPKAKAQDPEQTRMELESWLPREHWASINVTLVGFGQSVCPALDPKCGACSIAHLCPAAHTPSGMAPGASSAASPKRSSPYKGKSAGGGKTSRTAAVAQPGGACSSSSTALAAGEEGGGPPAPAAGAGFDALVSRSLAASAAGADGADASSVERSMKERRQRRRAL